MDAASCIFSILGACLRWQYACFTGLFCALQVLYMLDALHDVLHDEAMYCVGLLS